MGLYNFDAQFVPKIEAGEKTHTIRAKREHPAKVGETLYLYTGLRHKGARLLMHARCTRVESIYMAVDARGRVQVFIEGEQLADDEREALAKRDGFAGWREMADFWNGRYPFSGDIIHWKRIEEVA